MHSMRAVAVSRSAPVRATLPVVASIAACSLWLSAITSHASAPLNHFETTIRPLLATHCQSCHGNEAAKGGLRLDSLVDVLRGGDSGPAVVPGDPAASLLVAAVRHESVAMPPDRDRLSDGQIAALEAWVADGLPWTGSESAADLLAAGLPPRDAAAPVGPRLRPRPMVVTEEDRGWWAYRPLVRPAVPEGAGGHPIDRFVDARLAAEGLVAVPEADRATLIRRLFFTTVGVPPSAEEVRAFVADTDPAAWERLVDRLLADPRHAEHLARHWLDLARYADSDGFRQDAFRPHAWRYRDWVVAAFQADLPFDRFVIAQLAGDELSDDASGAIATGFLRQAPYEYNQIDVPKQWTDILDDATETTADVFLAMGLGCARCHDHKYDPILKADHERLRAFFTAIEWRDDGVAAPQALSPGQQTWVDTVGRIQRELATLRASARDEGAWGGLQRFPPPIKRLVMLPAAERTALEEQWVRLAARQLTFQPEKLPEADRLAYERLTAELVAFEKEHAADRPPSTPAAVVAEGGVPEGIPPGLPEVLGGGCPPIEPVAARGPSSGRRLALARWIAAPANPLAPRVLANRLWQWHFGEGLASEANDFGLLGAPPSHPQLLDWLAADLVEGGYTVRRIERLILTSSAFRRATHAPESPPFTLAAARDPQARLLWRRHARRLDAEQVRDAALVASGELDATTAGPPVPAAKPRRALYVSVLRNTRDPLLDAFDFPDAAASCSRRNTTTTPSQALLLLNGEWLLARARALALRIDRQGLGDDRSRAAEALRTVIGREPSAETIEACTDFLGLQRSRLDADASTFSVALSEPMPQREGLAATIDPARPDALLTVPGSASGAKPEAGPFPANDFTFEAAVVLRSFPAEGRVRTIASQGFGSDDAPGWSLDVDAAGRLGLKVRGTRKDGETKIPVRAEIDAGLRLALERPYAIAVAVRVVDAGDRRVDFQIRDLSDNDAAARLATVTHGFDGSHATSQPFAIGGRSGCEDSSWDGLIDEVRLSRRALQRAELLQEQGSAGDAVVAAWTFEETPGFAVDTAGRGRDLVRGGLQVAPVKDLRGYEALVDLCHVLLNSSDFLYVD